MFVRITVNRLHQDSRQQLGILHAVRYLNDDQKLTPSEFGRADKVFKWLYSHLDAPSKKTLRSNPTAVSWFRVDAREHIKRIERLIPIVEAHGYVTKRRTCLSPGKIIYSDAVQAFAVRRPSTQPSGSRQRRDVVFARLGRHRGTVPEPGRSATHE
jgi:hypothetical protein